MITADAGAARPDGVNPGSVAGADDDRAGIAVTGFTMLGTPGAQMCDEDGVCEVPSPRTSQMSTDLGLDGA